MRKHFKKALGGILGAMLALILSTVTVSAETEIQRPTADSLEFYQPPTAQPGSSVSPEEKIVMGVFKRVHPAVVNIVTKVLVFGFSALVPEEGQGTGFVIDRAGYILTNHHVVEQARQIEVTMGDGRKTDAALVGTDPINDLAVLKVPPDMVTVVAPLGDSDRLRVGQKAIAIGNPFGLSQTLTTGSISALHREIPNSDGEMSWDLIQTDAAINPGNSGGPLLNTAGEVIGINAAIFSMSGGYQGIGFAIPSNKAREVAMQLITTGHYRPTWMGIMGLGLDRTLARKLGLETHEGVLVVEVAPKGPAEKAGLRGGKEYRRVEDKTIPVGGDIILSLAGKKMKTMGDIIREVEKRKPGEKVKVEILRDRKKQTVEVTLD